MKLNFKFETENATGAEKVYDERANIEYNGLLTTDNVADKLNDINELMDIVISTRTFEVGEKISINHIINSDDDVYIRECRKAWDILWTYFNVEEYRDICFLKGKGLSLTDQEKSFLKSYFEEVCRPSKAYLDAKINKKKERREVKSFLDRRKKHLDEDEKEMIQWAAKNLYQMIRQRSGITEEIKKRFYESTKDISYIREQRFVEISDSIEKAKKLAFDDSDDDCLKIREKELWVEGFADAIMDMVKKWNAIYKTMEELKRNAGSDYEGIIQPRYLLEDAMKKENEVK